MILDLLSNASLYHGLAPRLIAGLEFLARSDLEALPLGKTIIDGEQLFALVQDYVPKPANVLRYEAHQRYWDVQYVVRGAEWMGWNSLCRMTMDESYDVERDVAFFRGPGDLFHVPAGTFAIFGPHDVHMPGVARPSESGHEPGFVRKVVVKVAG